MKTFLSFVQTAPCQTVVRTQTHCATACNLRANPASIGHTLQHPDPFSMEDKYIHHIPIITAFFSVPQWNDWWPSRLISSNSCKEVLFLCKFEKILTVLVLCVAEWEERPKTRSREGEEMRKRHLQNNSESRIEGGEDRRRLQTVRAQTARRDE